MNPKVSVIVPVYNVEKYLTICLKSILGQTFKDIELIVVNDGSLDNSQAIIDQLALLDSRIISVKKENGGVSSARNEALKHVTGEYIFFVDSDDSIEPATIEKLYERAKKDKLEIVCCLVKTSHCDTGSEIFDPYFNQTHLPENLSHSNFNYKDIAPYIFDMSVTTWNKLYSKTLIERISAFFPDGLHFEDNVFFLQTMLNANLIGFVTEKLYTYRVSREDYYSRQ